MPQALTGTGRRLQAGPDLDGALWLEDAALGDQTRPECVQWSVGARVYTFKFYTLTAAVNGTWPVAVFELIKNEGNPAD